MASYTTNIINISLLKQYKSSFTQEKNRFNNTSYKTFSSSYLKTCSDSNIKRMSNTLDSIYKKIQKGYNSIDKWWEAYNNNAEGLENSLSNCNLSGITKSSLRAFVSANLIDLPNYKNNLTSSFNYNQIVSSFNSKFSNNSVGVSSSFTPVNNVSKSVSDKKVESYVSKINNFDLIGNVGAVATSANSRINGWVDNAIEDVTGLFEETKAKVTKFGNNVKSKVDEVVGNAKQSLIDTFAFISNKVKNLWNKFVNWLIGDALPWIKTSAVVVCDVLKSVGATVATFVVSLVEGIGQFGEAVVDLFALVGTGIASIVTGLIDGGQAIYGAITGNEWSSVTKQMWEGTKGFVSKSYVSGWFDSFYNNTKAGNSLKNNSYFFDTVRGVGSGLGYVAGVVALSVVTFGAGGVAVTTATGATVTISSTAGMSIIAGLAGFGKGTQNAWADGADIGDGLVTGALTGVWEGIQFYVGAKIGQSSIWGKATTETAKASLPIGKKILDSLARITLDAVDGGVEGFVQPLINSIYKDSYIDENGNVIKFSDDIDFATKYKELFDDAGGWKNVGIQTAIGAGSSALGEAFDLGKLLRDKVPNGKTVTNVEVVEAVSENIENNIKDIYNKKLSVTKTVGGILATPLNIFSRFKNADVTDNIEISNKVLNDGIYHFTSLDNATKILDSGYVKESDYFVSYGKKKSFFFAGIPTVDDLAVNVRGLEPKRVAVKFDIDADNLVDFKYRKFADKAISYEGRYNFDKTKASIAYLGLFEENGELVYKEISKADFDNYKCDVSTSKLTTSINKCKSTMLAMARELDYFSENVSRLKNLLSNTSVKETASFVSENSESIIQVEPFTLKSSQIVGDNLDIKKIIEYEDQLKFIEDTNIRSLIKSIPKSDVELDKTVSDALADKILKNQDYLFTQIDVFGQSEVSDFYEFVTRNDKLLKNISDENLVRLLNITSKKDELSIIIDEISNRVSKGSKIFAMSSIEDNSLPPFVIKDTSAAFKKLQPDLQDIIYNNYQSLWENVPNELKEYDYGKFYQNYHLASLIDDGNIDPNYVRIITDLHNENPNLLKTFNFDLLDKGIVDKLGIDYVKEMGRYDTLSVEIVSLYKNNPTLFNTFSDIVINSKIDDSLNTFYMKNKCTLDFLFQNASELNQLNNNALNQENLMEYILYRNNSYSKFSSGKIIIDYTHDYLEKYIEQCDLEFNKALNSNEINKLDNMKNVYFNKYYSISFDEAKTFVSKYYEHITEVSKYDCFKDDIPGLGATVLGELRYIIELKDSVELEQMYNNQKIRLSAEEIMTLDSHLKKMYSSSYVDALQNTRNNIDFLIKQGKSSKEIYNGKEIDVVDLNDDFSFLVYSSDTGFVVAEKKLINDSYIDTWNSVENAKTHGLSTSYISNNNIGCCPVKGKGVLYAFDDISTENIGIMAPYDLDSHIADYGFGSGNKQIYISADNMSFNTTRVYNEIVLDRANVKPNAVIVYSNATGEEFNNALKAAYEWEIPVVRIDKVALANQQIGKINNLLDNFSNTGDLKSLKEAVDLYEANVSGYKFNASEETKNTDYTASINHEEVRDLFQSSKISDSIMNFISSISNSTDRVEKGEELKRILESVEKKYEVANQNGTSAITKTESSLGIESFVELIKQYLKFWKVSKV